MRAAIIRKFGDPSLFEVGEMPTPVAGPDEVLVAVRASSINPSDVKNVAGKMHGTTLPRIPGRDFAGVIVSGPAELTGKEVWGTGGDVGFTRDGAHAEFLLLPRAAVAAKPAALSMDAAGAAGVTFVTAWSAMVTVAAVGADDTVLIIGAAGGVGSAALQIAAARGARVLAAVRSDEDVALVRGMGAAEAINIKSAPLIEAVGKLTGNRGADVVFDTSGRMFAEAVEAASVEARVPVITAPPDGKTELNLRTLYRKELRVRGIDTRRLDVAACAKLLDAMAPAFEAGHFTVQESEQRPLADAVAAYHLAAAGGKRIVLRP